MNLEQTKKKVLTKEKKRIEYATERAQFRSLIVSNPNYFGNIKISSFKPVLNIKSSTIWEEIGSVGFQPQFNRLEAVIFVNQPSGYGGGICSQGSKEYVRFYASSDMGATWDDLGLTSFTVYDIPEGTEGAKRLEYDVSLQISPKRKLCFFENIQKVRAILSWGAPPPPNDPDFVPVWGEIHNTFIQIEPFKLIIIKDLLKALNVNITEQIEQSIDLDQEINAKSKQLEFAEIHQMYSEKGVELHRYAMPLLQKNIEIPEIEEGIFANNYGGLYPELKIDWSEVIGNLQKPIGNTRYEELECVGLNQNQDVLAGVIRVKKPFGFSGGLCAKGSTEYVTFWADVNNNGFYETYLGTTSVNVHDIHSIPQEGLEYSVFLPVNLNKYRKPCTQGAVVIPIRAILSWQVMPPANNPNYIPVWGNREETLIFVKPGNNIQTHTPIIETVGSMGVPDINPLSGLANGVAALAGFLAQESPFGGEVIITGHLANPTDISNGGFPLKYRVSVSDDGGINWQPLTNSFSVGRSQLLNGVWSFLPNVTQIVDGDNFYTYREDLTGGIGNAQQFVIGNVLARWKTGGQNGPRLIRIESKDVLNNVYVSSVVKVYLDNVAPTGGAINPLRPHIAITSGGGDCADFKIGDIVSGVYTVSDQHFGSLNIVVEPSLGGTFTIPVLPRKWPIVPTTGESGTWALNTAGMPKCGYVIRISARDRTIVNSGYVGFYNDNVVGLCLRES